MRIVPDTYFTVAEEVRLFGLSCLMGAAVGAAYDVLRTFRMILHHNKMLTAVEDILFLAAYSAALTAFSSAAAKGELRAYFAIGNILGAAVYFVTVGNIVVKTLRKLFSIIKAALKLFFRPVVSFFAPLCKKVTINFVGYFQIIVKRFKKIKIVLLKVLFLLYNKMENKKRKNVKNVAKKTKERKTE